MGRLSILYIRNSANFGCAIVILLYCGGQPNRISKLFNNIRLVISPRDKIRCTLAHTHSAYGMRVVSWWWCYGSILASSTYISIYMLMLTNNQQQSDGKIEYIISTKQTNYELHLHLFDTLLSSCYILLHIICLKSLIPIELHQKSAYSFKY